MIGINLLFLSAFLFLGNVIFRQRHSTAKYALIACIMIFVNLPIFFVLWDYYSPTKLFYSLFGGVSVFCALLILRFVAMCIFRDFGSAMQRFAPKLCAILPKDSQLFAPNPRVFVVIFVFSAVLFLGHLDLVAFDIFSQSRAIIAIFVAIFIIALYLTDKITGILGLFAFIIALIFAPNNASQNAIFALFDGYLLIFSFFYSVIWGFCKIKAKIKSQSAQ